MNTIPRLMSIVRQEMSDLISAHNWDLIEFDDKEVFLKAPKYAIYMRVDGDTVRYAYFDAERSPVVGYDLTRFFIEKKQNQLQSIEKKAEQTNYAEFLRQGVDLIARELRANGRDILKGSKEWQQEYRWEPFPPGKEIIPTLMRPITPLISVVRQEMGDLISAYNWDLIEFNNKEIFLKALKYTIYIMADRDGVSYTYFDTEKNPIIGYNLVRFFVGKRRDQLQSSEKEPEAASYAEFLKKGVGAIARGLRAAGRDILEGSKEWQREYRWEPFPPSREIIPFL